MAGLKTLRRLGADAAQDTYSKTRRGSVRNVELNQDAFRALERDRPNAIVVEGDAVLVAEPRSGRIELHYAFPDTASFSRQFPPMFRRVIEQSSIADAPFGVALRLTDRSRRAYVEPALFAQAFEVTREWLRMELSHLPEDVMSSDAIAQGFTLRAARGEDVEAIIALIEASFDNPSVNPRMWAEAVEGRGEVSVMEDSSRGLAGLLHIRPEDTRTGYVSELAIHPDYQRRGLGEALMRRALSLFRECGLRRAALTTSPDNARAIALYQKLGFSIAQIGVDYRRSLDQDEVARLAERRRGAHITVRRAFP